ncbi:MAG: LacI family DNA-binding transcriptional regulator [Rhizobiaceae bacterium]
MVKLLDVARAAGVSRSTASNVFAHPERVKEELRERVLAAADEIGYGGPSPAGRLLRLGKVNAIGVTPPGAYGTKVAFSNPYLREFLCGVATVCDERGASLTIISGIGPDKTSGIKNSLVDGFILHQIEDAALLETRRRRLPFVLIDSQGDAKTSFVRIDDRGGAYMAAKHLTDLGHRRFAIFSVLRRDLAEVAASRVEPVFHGVSGPSHKLLRGFSMDDDRLAGYADALAEVGISIDDVPIVECAADSVTNATSGARVLFDRAPETTAVLAMTDVQALAVLEEARRRNVLVPEELSVIGFDDIAESRTAAPSLTTVVHPVVEKGRTAANILFDDQTARQVTLPVHLAVRSSTAVPRRTRILGPGSPNRG